MICDLPVFMWAFCGPTLLPCNKSGCRPTRKGKTMKTAKWMFAGFLFAIASSAFAADWTRVASDSSEVVFVDRGSIYEAGNLKKARVLRSYSNTQTIGDDAYPHKSEIL